MVLVKAYLYVNRKWIAYYTKDNSFFLFSFHGVTIHSMCKFLSSYHIKHCRKEYLEEIEIEAYTKQWSNIGY